VLYVDSLSAENGPVPTYIDLLNVTTRTLVQGIRAAIDPPGTLNDALRSAVWPLR
jgi:hypothetical protein